MEVKQKRASVECQYFKLFDQHEQEHVFSVSVPFSERKQDGWFVILLWNLFACNTKNPRCNIWHYISSKGFVLKYGARKSGNASGELVERTSCSHNSWDRYRQCIHSLFYKLLCCVKWNCLFKAGTKAYSRGTVRHKDPKILSKI